MTTFLAFETSCDDTAVAIVQDGNTVLASCKITQTEHEDWGGVVPELAARLHSENWQKTLQKCLDEASLKIEAIDFFAVTKGPGLQTSLLTGTCAASFLSLLYQKPLIPVHHIYGHICSVFLDRNIQTIIFPSLVLTVSGGHTQMHLWKSETDLELLGTTLDDAAGEAFDKVAKMLGLGYPGGPIVSKMAEKGDRNKYDFPKIYLEKESLNFSFSGLKAAVYRAIETEKKRSQNLSNNFVRDVCSSFEFAVWKNFEKKISRAIQKFPEIKSIVFVGGVSANTYLKKNIEAFLTSKNIKFLTPNKLEYSTDNAAMIASAAYFLWKENPKIAQIKCIDGNSRMPL